MLIDILLNDKNDYENIANTPGIMADILNASNKETTFDITTIFDEIQDKINMVTADNIGKLIKAFSSWIENNLNEKFKDKLEGTPEAVIKFFKGYYSILYSLIDYQSVVIMFFREDGQKKESQEELRMYHMIADRVKNILDEPNISILKSSPTAADTSPESVELGIIPRGKITYPAQDDKVTIPVLNSFMMNADNVLSDNDEKIILNDQQYRLLSAVRIAVDENEKHGDGQHLFTLDSIVRYWKGKGAETIPTQAEREQVANMLDFFFNINAYTYTNTGQKVKFKFMHMDIVENAEIHGTVTNAYRIYNVFTPPANHEIYYYQFSLPKGYLNNLENATLWAEIIDKSRKTTDNHKIDFESICRKLGVTKNNRKKRHDLYQKIIDMIKYYNFSNMSIESSYHGTLSIEEIK